MFLKNKNIIFEIIRSKVTDYAALKRLPRDLAVLFNETKTCNRFSCINHLIYTKTLLIEHKCNYF